MLHAGCFWTKNLELLLRKRIQISRGGRGEEVGGEEGGRLTGDLDGADL